MPRACVNFKAYKIESIGSWIVGQLFKKRLKKTALAEALDITRQGLDWKLRNNSFDYADLITIFDFLRSTNEEIIQVMRIYEG